MVVSAAESYREHPPMPPPDRQYAMAKGLDADAVDDLWEAHCVGSIAKGFETVGGIPWRRYVDAAVRRENDAAALAPALTQDAAERLRRQKAEDRAKAIQEAAYEAEAVSFADYLASLDCKPETELTPAELALSEAGLHLDPQRVDPGQWILEALKKARPAPRGGHCSRCGRPMGNAVVTSNRAGDFLRCSCPGAGGRR